jgi:1-phosphatidylinositol-4-phosphate 5-kinase
MMQAYPPQHLLTEVNGTVFAQRLEGQDSRPARRSSSEESVPDRTLSTMRSPSAERTNDRAGMTLPVVDEAGESSSTGGRSGTDDEARRESRPPTPPKDHPITAKRRHEPEIRKSSDSNKALPPLPT